MTVLIVLVKSGGDSVDSGACVNGDSVDSAGEEWW